MTEPSPLLIEDYTLPVDDAFDEAERVIRGDAFVSKFLNSLVTPAVRDEVVAYMAECLLAERPVTPTYAVNYLGYWNEFRASLFRLLSLEEDELVESAGEGVTLSREDVEVLQEAGAVFRSRPGGVAA